MISTAKPATKRRTVSYDCYGYFFVAPFFIVFLIFQLYPILFTFYTSCTDAAGWDKILNNSFAGLANFGQFFDPSSSTFEFFWGSIQNTVIMLSLIHI